MRRQAGCAFLALALVLSGCGRPGPGAASRTLARLEAGLESGDRERTTEAAAETLWTSQKPAQVLAPFSTKDGALKSGAGPCSACGLRSSPSPFFAAVPATSDPNAALTEDGYVPRRLRTGPAYPDDLLRSLGRYGKEFLPEMWDDVKYTFTDPAALTLLGLSGAAGIAINGSGCDETVADHYQKHGNPLNTEWDMVGDIGGNPGLHFAVGGAMWFAALGREDNRGFEAAESLLQALAINGVATMGLKYAARTEAPNGEGPGWPSGHTSSSFCLAAVMDKHYGPWAGVPLYAFASYVGFERIGARNHDFSDVISGALIGIAIGNAVSRNHQPRVMGMDVLPFTDPRTGAVGLALYKQW